MAEAEAFVSMARTLSDHPGTAVQRLVEIAMKATGAGSAGISVAEGRGESAKFRWIAVAGAFEPFVQGTMPRDFSPCGAVLDAGRTLLMRDPERHYGYMQDFRPAVRSALLVPFARKGALVGTLWVLSHSSEKWFTADDVQVVESLTVFVTSILDTLETAHT